MHRRGAALAAMVMVLMAGCGDEQGSGSDDGGREPTTFAVVKDAAAFDTTRIEVGRVVREASEAANDALGGEGLRGNGKIRDSLCNEAYPRRFSQLEGGFTLRAPGGALTDAVDRVLQAWEERGWTVQSSEPDRVLLSTETSTGVPFTVQATLQVNQTDPVTLGASLAASTRCLKLPQDVADNL